MLVNNNLYGKLASSFEFPVRLDEKFQVTSGPFFVADFNLLSCEGDSFTFNVLCWVVLY